MIKLFIGGLPQQTDEMELAQLFDPHGKIETIKIVRDRASGRSKGFAFIEMADAEGAGNAIAALDQQAFYDKVLDVRITEDKPAAPPKPRFSQGRQPSFTPRTSNYGNNNNDMRKKRPRRPL